MLVYAFDYVCIVRYIFSMHNTAINPTEEIYAQIQMVADAFNVELFAGQLPKVLFTLQRGKKSAGYFAPNRWRHQNGVQVGEIALNPMFFASQPLIQLLQTIAHEMCHLWQHMCGQPGRAGYHNKEWANRMQEIGLMPSSTGMPGGMPVGQKMSDYPVAGGRFLQVCSDLIAKDFKFSWVDQGYAPRVTSRAVVTRELISNSPVSDVLLAPLEVLFPSLKSQLNLELASQKRKIRYQCPICKTNIWGKKGLSLICGACNVQFAADCIVVNEGA